MDWKEELLKRLDALAAKLGTTGEYLWRVLIKQSYVEGVSTTLESLFWLALAIGSYVCLKYVLQACKREDDSYRRNIFDDPGYFFGALFCLGGIVGFGIGSAYCLEIGLMHIFNPEFYALQQVLQTLK